MAVDALEPGGVLLFRETFNLHHVHLAAVVGVGERNLFVEIRHESQRLQVTVELRHFGHGDPSQQLHHVAHGDVVGEPHLVRHAGELPVCCERFHSLGQTSTETESCPARSEPETQPRLKQMEKCNLTELNVTRPTSSSPPPPPTRLKIPFVVSAGCGAGLAGAGVELEWSM